MVVGKNSWGHIVLRWRPSPVSTLFDAQGCQSANERHKHWAAGMILASDKFCAMNHGTDSIYAHPPPKK